MTADAVIFVAVMVPERQGGPAVTLHDWWPENDATPSDRIPDPPLRLSPEALRLIQRARDPWDREGPTCGECGARLYHAGRCSRIGGPGYVREAS